mgnify:CR=1 FL=1
MTDRERDRTLFRDRKVDKLCRIIRGTKVELPVKERKLSNNIVMNPKTTDDIGGYGV